MSGNYDGLTRNLWPGTWSASSTHPIVNDSDLRGALRYIGGGVGDRLTDITGQRLQEGMLVYVKAGYTASGYTRKAESYYQYKLLAGQSRDINTGATPNAEANWKEFEAGGGGTGALGFVNSSENPGGSGLTYQRDLVTFYDTDGPKAIRKFLTYNDTITGQPMFALQLATFSPNISSTTTPGASLNWDVPCTGFSVSIDNPTDFTTQYISSVNSLVQTAGTVSALLNFTPGTRSSTPGGGVDWTQTFSTNATASIRPTSTTITGGNAGANVRYNVFSGSESLFGSSSTISVTWATPSLGISVTPLSGSTFLKTYESTTYNISVSGLSDSSNRVHAVTAIAGTIDNALGDGTFTFTTPIHKNNTITPRTVHTSTTFTRPATVTGTSYSAVVTASAAVTASFTYPSFWVFTSGTTSPPTVSTIVDGSDFKTGVNVLGNQVSTFGTTSVDNTTGAPAAFWFGVKADISQPTTFKTGASTGLMSDVAVTKGNTVSLQPSPAPGGYVAVSYTLYGITLQKDVSFISIA